MQPASAIDPNTIVSKLRDEIETALKGDSLL
jgi:hypothetical protein